MLKLLLTLTSICVVLLAEDVDRNRLRLAAAQAILVVLLAEDVDRNRVAIAI